jgi:Protein of unknown function (DUF2877)
VIAADASAVYLELPPRSPEPRVIVLSASDVPRLPNAVALTSRPDPPAPAALDRIALATELNDGQGSAGAGHVTGMSGAAAARRAGADGRGASRGANADAARNAADAGGAGSAVGAGEARGGAGAGGAGSAVGAGAARGGAGGAGSAVGAGAARGGADIGGAVSAVGDAWVGRGTVQVGGLTVRVLRWWDPAPVLGPLSRARLEQGAAALQRACASARYGPSLADHGDPAMLAAYCAEGDLAGAVETAERMAGLGPGLAPGGDNMISGLLLALRLLGGAIPGGTRAVWLADWLGAAVTSDAELRTTSLGATLLYCAAHGQATAEVSAVLLALAGQHPLGPAIRTLLAAGQPVVAEARAARKAAHAIPAQPAGADLAWGLVAGCRAALALAQPGR